MDRQDQAVVLLDNQPVDHPVFAIVGLQVDQDTQVDLVDHPEFLEDHQGNLAEVVQASLEEGLAVQVVQGIRLVGQDILVVVRNENFAVVMVVGPATVVGEAGIVGYKVVAPKLVVVVVPVVDAAEADLPEEVVGIAVGRLVVEQTEVQIQNYSNR